MVKRPLKVGKTQQITNHHPTISLGKEFAVTLFLPHTIGEKKRLLWIVTFVLILFPSFAIGAETVDTEEWQITADKITRYENPESIVAEGNIILKKMRKVPPKQEEEKSDETDWATLLEEEPEKKEITPEELAEEGEVRYETDVVIKADWMAYDVALESVRARGNIAIETESDQLYAEKGTVNLKKMTGKFSNATVIRDEKDFHLEGEMIEKTGLKTYEVEDGWVITCKIDKDETPPWSFAASDTEVTHGGYAYLKHVRFNIRNVPVFYLPYLILPAKDTRQSGVLFPELSYSTNNGLGINIPIFYNISDSADLTFYPEFLANRGFMAGLEFRYVSSENNKGMFMGSYLYDNLSDPSETEYYEDTGYTHTNKDRYWLRGKLDHTFGDGWITRLDIDIVSDRDYLEEFDFSMVGHEESNKNFIDVFGRGFEINNDSRRENSLKILKNWGDISLETTLLAINDASDTPRTTTTVNEDGTSTTVTNSTPIWELPSVEAGGVHSLGDSTVSLTWDVDYINYWREEGVGGQRIDIHPRLSMPIPVGSYLESRAEAGIRETLYMVKAYGDSEWTTNDTPSRFMYDFNVEVGTTLLREFQVGSPSYEGLSHEVRPYIKYAYVADVDQDDLPSFNSVDRIGHQNGITYGFSNYFDLFGTKDGEEFSDRIAKVSFQQTYDIRSEASDEPFGPIEMELKLTPWSKFNFDYKTWYDVYDNDFTYHRLSSDYTNSRGDSIDLDYLYENSGTTEQINAKFSLKLLASLTGAYEIKYSLSQEEIDEQNIGLTYQANCWSVTFKSSYTPEDTSFIVLFELLNIGSPIQVSL